MTIRPATPADLADIQEIDGTIESSGYAHVEMAAGDDVAGQSGATWTLGWRPAREKLILSSPLSDETLFMLKQVVTGGDEGVALMAEHDGMAVALLLAQADTVRQVMHILDLRVDSDIRRQGIATVLLFQLIERAKEADLRAAYITTRTNNAPVARLLEKLGWELSGIDTKRHDNHDLVKESATLMWYYVIK
ncbi:MAG TPA: GNAT family N-acetyltransferase [Tepidisphaeraceae bacterium]|jgi:ribosomal protein S18 acetylase RimI-like enzyme